MAEINIPKGWTYLIHGTNISRWEENPGDLEIINIQRDLSCVAEAIAKRDASGGAFYTAKSYGGKTGNIQIRILIYKNIFNYPDDDGLKLKLTAEELSDISKYYFKNQFNGRHECVPSGTRLIKIETTSHDDIDNSEDNVIYWFVPEKYYERYLEDCRESQHTR